MADNRSNKPRNTEKPFLNPYNFVTFKEATTTRGITSEKGTLTGELKCKIKTKTRVFVPESQPYREENGHKFFAFMKNEKGECIIPGSSLRGVLRNTYETATDSCFSTLKNTRYLSSRYNGNNKLIPGLLIKGVKGDREQWVLYNAEEYLLLANIKDDSYPDEKKWRLEDYEYDRTRTHIVKGNTVERNTIIGMLTKDKSLWIENTKDKKKRIKIETGDSVIFSVNYDKREVRNGVKKEIVSSIRKKPKDTNKVRLNRDEKEGYLVIGEQGDEASAKHYCRVFAKIGNGIDIERKYIDQVNDLIAYYGDPKINKKLKVDGEKQEGKRHRGYQYLLKKDVIPVMYEKDKDNRYYFQFATMGRRVYDKKLEDFADDIHKPCKTKESLCPACTLFGMIGKDKNTNVAWGSRIRISDAEVETPLSLSEDINKWDRLSILSNPHIYLPFFQTSVDEEKKGDIFNENYEGKGISLKGRKFYLHAPSDDKYFKRINSPDGVMSDQNITAQTIGKDTEFSFSVYFENVTEKELRTLIRAINLGENDINGKYCHKIGHGKSIGMGSAKIIVEDVIERSFSDGTYKVENRNETRLSDLDNDEDTLLSEDYYRSLKEICDFDKITELYNKGIDIHYPGADDETENGFEWFSSNASAARQSEPKNDDWQTLTDFSEIYNSDDPLEGRGRKAKVLYDWKR